MNTRMAIILFVLILLFAVTGSVITDIRKKQKYKKIPANPKQQLDIKVNEVLWQLENSMKVNLSQLNDTFKYIETRHDCSDFHLQSLLRIICKHNDKLDDLTRKKLRILCSTLNTGWMNPARTACVTGAKTTRSYLSRQNT